MSKFDKPAFPTTHEERTYSGTRLVYRDGLTKREYFAAKAMQGILANLKREPGDKLGGSPVNVADWAIDYADALLAALEQSE